MSRYIFILLLLPALLWSQNDEVIQIGVLPSAYGDGMPLKEFMEFEKNVIKHLDKVDRYEVVKKPEDYADLLLDGDFFSVSEQIKNQAITDNVPFMVQMEFGDTEWTDYGGSVAISSKEATVWLTINVYNVSTGTLQNSFTVMANSSAHAEFSKAPAPYKADPENAVNAAQKALWKKTIHRIKTLFPLDINVMEVQQNPDKKEVLVKLDIGRFHGVQKGDRLPVFYEQEYTVRGTKVNRHIEVGEVKIVKVEERIVMAVVKKGKKKIPQAYDEGKVLKGIIIHYSASSFHYGF